MTRLHSVGLPVGDITAHEGASDPHPGYLTPAEAAAAYAALGHTHSGFTGARAYRSGALSIPNTTATAIAFDAETYDSATLHDNTTNPSRITVPTAGKYLVTGAVRYAAGTAGTYRAVRIYRNGSAIAANWAPSVNATVIPSTIVTDIVTCAAGDYLELVAYHDSGAALSLTAGSEATFLSVARIGD